MVISLHIPSEIQNGFTALLQEFSFSALLLPLDKLDLRVDGQFRVCLELLHGGLQAFLLLLLACLLQMCQVIGCSGGAVHQDIKG